MKLEEHFLELGGKKKKQFQIDSNDHQNLWRENPHIETTRGASNFLEQRGIIKASVRGSTLTENAHPGQAP